MTAPPKPLRIAIVAGEPSGDLLGAGLLRALIRHQERDPILRKTPIRIEGIGGPRMMAQGCESLYPMERLSVSGILEVLPRIPEILSIRAGLVRRFRTDPPDVFIGIDAPDFNLSLEEKLRKIGIPVVHYVSPTVWAWRGYRIKKIARAVDLMLTLFPFETRIYREHRIPARFVGHPLADTITAPPDRDRARRVIDLPPTGKVVALLPGSRLSEVGAMATPMVQTARWLAERQPGIRFVAPLVNAVTRGHFEKVLAREGRDLPVTVLEGEARAAMAAADAVLVTVGTATLEALLLERPMVIALRVSPLTYRIGKALATVRAIGLPNLLAGDTLVPELLQKDVTPEKLGRAILDILEDTEGGDRVLGEYRRIGAMLRHGADESAAAAVRELLESSSRKVSDSRP
uniref:Lipid-A-disaccharide synthase n=1 Tax=Candidatus Kentrum sp. DK TaxID=2126562 RepID=A0A450SQI5_9GAMM|nr:MAG: lipid-A-disaccharide synthase [Candidatus Kentron sp. DK]